MESRMLVAAKYAYIRKRSWAARAASAERASARLARRHLSYPANPLYCGIADMPPQPEVDTGWANPSTE